MDGNLDEEHAQSERSKSRSSEIDLAVESRRGRGRPKGWRSTMETLTIKQENVEDCASQNTSRQPSRASRSTSVVSREETVEGSAPRREVRERKRKREFSPDTSASYNRRSTISRAVSHDSNNSPGFATPDVSATERRKSKTTLRYSPGIIRVDTPDIALNDFDEKFSCRDLFAKVDPVSPSNYELPRSYSDIVPTRLHGICSAERYWGKTKPRSRRSKPENQKEMDDNESAVASTDRKDVPLLQDLISEAEATSNQSKLGGRPIKKVGIRLRQRPFGARLNQKVKEETLSNNDTEQPKTELPSTYSRRPRSFNQKGLFDSSEQTKESRAETPVKCPLLEEVLEEAFSLDLSRFPSKDESLVKESYNEETTLEDQSINEESVEEKPFEIPEMLKKEIKEELKTPEKQDMKKKAVANVLQGPNRRTRRTVHKPSWLNQFVSTSPRVPACGSPEKKSAASKKEETESAKIESKILTSPKQPPECIQSTPEVSSDQTKESRAETPVKCPLLEEVLEEAFFLDLSRFPLKDESLVKESFNKDIKLEDRPITEETVEDKLDKDTPLEDQLITEELVEEKRIEISEIPSEVAKEELKTPKKQRAKQEVVVDVLQGLDRRTRRTVHKPAWLNQFVSTSPRTPARGSPEKKSTGSRKNRAESTKIDAELSTSPNQQLEELPRPTKNENVREIENLTIKIEPKMTSSPKQLPEEPTADENVQELENVTRIQDDFVVEKPKVGRPRGKQQAIQKLSLNLRNRSIDSATETESLGRVSETTDEPFIQHRFRILSPKKERPKSHLPKYVPSIKPLIGSLLLANGHLENLGQAVNQVVNKLMFEVCRDGITHHNSWLLTKDEMYQRNKERSRESRELRKNQPVVHRRAVFSQSDGIALNRSKRDVRNKYIGGHEPLHVSVSNEDYTNTNLNDGHNGATMAAAVRGVHSLSEFIQAFSTSATKEKTDPSFSPSTPQFPHPEIATPPVITDETPFLDVVPLERKLIPITFNDMLYNCGWDRRKIMGPHKGVINGDIFYREMLMDSSYDHNEYLMREAESDEIDILANEDVGPKQTENPRDCPPKRPGVWEESKLIATKICKLLPRPSPIESLDEESGEFTSSWTMGDAITLVKRLEESQNEIASMEKDSAVYDGLSSVLKPEKRRENKANPSKNKDFVSKCEYFERLVEIIGSQYLLEITCQQDSFENWQSVHYVESQRNAVQFGDIMATFSSERTKQSVDLHRYLIAFLPEPLLVSYITVLRHARQMKCRAVEILNKFIKQTSVQINTLLCQKADNTEEFPKRWIKIGKTLIAGSKTKVRDPNIDEISRTTLSRVLPDVIAICVNPNVYHEQYFDQRNRSHEYTYKLITQLCNAASVTVALDFSDVRHRLTVAEAMWKAIDQVAAAVRRAAKEHRSKRIVLFGWGTSTYINHRVIQTTPGVSAIVNFNFPTHSAFGFRGQADDDICLTYCPTLFVVGEEACDFNPDVMHYLRRNMINRSGLVVVGSANEQLCVSADVLVDKKITGKVVSRAVMELVIEFLRLDVTRQSRSDLVPVPLNDIYRIDPEILKPTPRPIVARSGSAYSSSLDDGQLPSPIVVRPPPPIGDTISSGVLHPKFPLIDPRPLEPSLSVAPPPRQHRPAMPPMRPKKRPSDDSGPPSSNESLLAQQAKSPFSGLMMASRQQAAQSGGPAGQRLHQQSGLSTTARMIPVAGGASLPLRQPQPPQTVGGSMPPRLQVATVPTQPRPPPMIPPPLVPPHRQLQGNAQIIHRPIQGFISVGPTKGDMAQTLKERARNMLCTALTNLQPAGSPTMPPIGMQAGTNSQNIAFALIQKTGSQAAAIRVGPPPHKQQRSNDDSAATAPTDGPVIQPAKGYIDPADVSLG